MCAMKDRANGNAKGSVATVAVVATLVAQCRYSNGITIRADRSAVPTNGFQEIETTIFGVNGVLPLNRTIHSYRAAL